MSSLTTKQTALRLGVSVRRVQQAIKAGSLPARKFGRDWVITEEDLAAYSPRRPGRPSKEVSHVQNDLS